MANTNLRAITDRVDHVVLSSTSRLIDVAKYENIAGFNEYCAEVHKEIKFLSEVLTCLHFSRPGHLLASSLVDGVRRILLHPYMLQAVRVNPLHVNWLLSALSLLQDQYALDRERNFVLALVDRYGLHTLDAPSYRVDENRYLFAKLSRQNYAPAIDRTFERNFYRLTRDQVYALTHLLFYVSDYGTRGYEGSVEQMFAIEHLIYDAYLNRDVDVMLELMLVYCACVRGEESSIVLFERLLAKLISSIPELHQAMTEIDSQYFPAYYHQCLLAVMYSHASARRNCSTTPLDLRIYRNLRVTHGFHVLLRSANYVKAAQRFAVLRRAGVTRLEFCRSNLEHYLALHRHDLGEILSVR